MLATAVAILARSGDTSRWDRLNAPAPGGMIWKHQQPGLVDKCWLLVDQRWLPGCTAPARKDADTNERGAEQDQRRRQWRLAPEARSVECGAVLEIHVAYLAQNARSAGSRGARQSKQHRVLN